MKALALLSFLALAACGTQNDSTIDQASKTVTQDGHLGLLFPDGAMYPYPTDVSFKQDSLCVSPDSGGRYALHIVVRNTSEVAGTFVLLVNGNNQGEYSIGALSDMAIETTIVMSHGLTLTIESDQTSARGNPDQQTSKMTLSTLTVSNECN